MFTLQEAYLDRTMIQTAKSLPIIGIILTLMMLPGPRTLAQSGEASLLQGETPAEPASVNEPSAEESKKATVAQFIKQGNDAYVEAQYEEAIAAYSQAIELYNQNAYAYYNRGNAYRKLDNAEAAFKDYTLALKLNPDNYYAYYYRGILFTGVEEYDNALRDFSAALELTDQNPSIFEKRGDTYRKLKDKTAANKDYKKAVDLYKKQGKELKAELLQRKIGRAGR